MVDQKLELSHQTQIGKISAKWEERFLIKRIEEKDIEITLNERNEILKSLNAGDRFVQVKKYTLMLNGIKSIDPKWGEKNIPPRPFETLSYINDTSKNTSIATITNQKELDEWDSLFKDK